MISRKFTPSDINEDFKNICWDESTLTYISFDSNEIDIVLYLNGDGKLVEREKYHLYEIVSAKNRCDIYEQEIFFVNICLQAAEVKEDLLRSLSDTMF